MVKRKQPIIDNAMKSHPSSDAGPSTPAAKKRRSTSLGLPHVTGASGTCPVPANRISGRLAKSMKRNAEAVLYAPDEAPPLPEAGTLAAAKPAKDVMKVVIAYVQGHLRMLISSSDARFTQFADVELFRQPPLRIPSTCTAGAPELVSYKNPWCDQDASVSLQKSCMYEAGGSVFWLNPFTACEEEEALAGKTPTFADIYECAPEFNAHQVPSSVAGNTIERVVFRQHLIIFGWTLDTFVQPEFAGCLKVLTGHVRVWAWYVEMLKAIESHDLARVALLLQAGLTVTLQARVGAVSDMAVLSMQSSGCDRNYAHVATDSFLFFARKLEFAFRGDGGDMSTARQLAFCSDAKIYFNGKPVSKCMLECARTINTKMTPAVKQSLQVIEDRHGKEALTAKHHCLSRLFSICVNEASNPQWQTSDAATLVELYLSYLTWALQHEFVKPEDITTEWLDKSKHGLPGSCSLVLAKAQLVVFFRNLLRDLPGPVDSGKKHEFGCILEAFSSYHNFDLKFYRVILDSDDRARPGTEPINIGSSGAQDLRDLLRKVFEGEYDKTLRTALHNLKRHSVACMDWLGIPGEVGREISRHARVLGVAREPAHGEKSTEPPNLAGPFFRKALARHESDENPDKLAARKAEKEEVWTRATEDRTKIANFGACKFAKEKDLQQWFQEQVPSCFHADAERCHRGQRVLIFAPDTFGAELGTEPWATPGKPCTRSAAVLEFMKKQSGPRDVLVAFDGRSQAHRKAVEEAIGSSRHSFELWVIYRPEVGHGRRVAWTSETRETCQVSLPKPRTAYSVTDRSAVFCGAGEECSFASTFTGVCLPNLASLPLISSADKIKIMSGNAPEPPEYDEARGMPLYWRESKSHEFWRHLLRELDASEVVDLSPGSGSAAKACVFTGIPYFGICRNETHASWLQNVLNRWALECITLPQSALHDIDRKALVKHHFSDIVQELNEMDAIAATR